MIYGYFNATGYLKKALESLQAVSIQHLFEKAVENKDEEIEPTQTRHCERYYTHTDLSFIYRSQK